MIPEKEETILLKNFNRRIEKDFGKVYSLFYNDLFYFTAKLYQHTEVEPRDAIHDVFLNLWQSPSLKFERLTDIKAYLYVSLRNHFKSYIRHHQCVEKYKAGQLLDKDSFEVDIIESETLSTFHYILGLLPEESAEILKLFFDGWKVEEIAQKLGKNKQTIYNKKSEAIAYLKINFLKIHYSFYLSWSIPSGYKGKNGDRKISNWEILALENELSLFLR